MSATVRDIAKAAGVSVGTVSRALKNQPGLSEETRDKVRDVAHQLGYDLERLHVEPLRRVLFLVHRQHDNRMSSPFFSAVLHGAEDACRQAGLTLSFMALGPGDSVAALMSRHAADGLLCAGFFEPELLRLLRQPGRPIVLLDHWDSESSCVNPDNETGAYLATRHLIDRGRRRIAFLASSLAHYSIRQRERGYRRALFEAGFLSDPDLECVAAPGTEVEESIRALVQELLERPERPDALFAYNDAAALIAMRECQLAGLSIPKDIAIIGFDDIDVARLSHPSLSTVGIDKAALGRRGVELLMQRNTRHVDIQPVKLIVRDST